MSSHIELVPLRCPKCQHHIPAEPDEIAWVCPNCQTSSTLDENIGLRPFEIKFAQGIDSGKIGRPFWVSTAHIDISRSTFSSAWGAKQEAEEFWGQPRTFYVPAYTCPIDEVIDVSAYLLSNPFPLNPGPNVPFRPVTLDKQDVQAYAEFVVLAIEAHRKDKVSKVHFNLQLQDLDLWILP